MTYNDIDRLRKTSESLLTQSDTSFEWLIVDGYSEDGTVEFVSRLTKNIRVTFVQAQPIGIYNAMNIGLENSTGSWINYLNSGDCLINDYVVSYWRKLVEENTDRKIIASPVIHTNRYKEIIDYVIPRIIFSEERSYFYGSHQGVIMKKDFIQSLGGFDEKLKYASDGKLLDNAIHKAAILLDSTFVIDFEAGGTAAKNIWTTMTEIQTYRPGNFNYCQKVFVTFKNYVKMYFLEHDATILPFNLAKRITQLSKKDAEELRIVYSEPSL